MKRGIIRRCRGLQSRKCPESASIFHQVETLEGVFVKTPGLPESGALLPGLERADQRGAGSAIDRTAIVSEQLEVFLSLAHRRNLHFRADGNKGSAFKNV